MTTQTPAAIERTPAVTALALCLRPLFDYHVANADLVDDHSVGLCVCAEVSDIAFAEGLFAIVNAPRTFYEAGLRMRGTSRSDRMAILEAVREYVIAHPLGAILESRGGSLRAERLGMSGATYDRLDLGGPINEKLDPVMVQLSFNRPEGMEQPDDGETVAMRLDEEVLSHYKLAETIDRWLMDEWARIGFGWRSKGRTFDLHRELTEVGARLVKEWTPAPGGELDPGVELLVGMAAQAIAAYGHAEVA
jgi:hypothetical protein